MVNYTPRTSNTGEEDRSLVIGGWAPGHLEGEKYLLFLPGF